MRASIRVCVRDDNKRSWKAGLEGEGEGEGDWKREDRGRERERESARERGQVKGLCHSSPAVKSGWWVVGRRRERARFCGALTGVTQSTSR